MSDAPAAAAEPRVAMTAAEKATEKKFQVVLRQRKYQTKAEINDRRTQLVSGQRIRPCPLFELISWGQVFGINYTDSWLCGLLPIFCRQSRITVTLAATTFDI
eukprot:COSAG06_NODE_8575_length_2125_cov_20.123889_5_plen_102_part_01